MAMELLQSGVLPAVTGAATTTTLILGEVPVRESEGSFNLDRVVAVSPTTVTGNGQGTINVRQLRAGSAVATVATLALASGVNLTAEVPTSIPISGTPALVAGDLLDIQWVQTGLTPWLPLPAGVSVAAELS